MSADESAGCIGQDPSLAQLEVAKAYRKATLFADSTHVSFDYQVQVPKRVCSSRSNVVPGGSESRPVQGFARRLT